MYKQKSTRYRIEKEINTKENILAQHDLADCIGTMQKLYVVKKTQHGIYLSKLPSKDSLDSTKSKTPSAEVFLDNFKGCADSCARSLLDIKDDTQESNSLESAKKTTQNLDSITNCHVERSETSNIESKKDFSPFSKAQNDKFLDSSKIVLLPNAYMNGDEEIGDCIEVFIHTDSSDRILATTKKPLAMLNEIARLAIKDSNKDGLFLDIGLAKDIFMPTKSFHQYANHTHIVVRITQDKMKRLIAKKDINPLLKPCKTQNLLHKNVKIWTISSSAIGILCVVLPHYYHGMIYSNTLSYPPNLYEEYEAKVVKVRNDGKLDLIITRDTNAVYNLIAKLNSKNEYFIVNDMSAKMLSMSKKGVKKELTNLLKQKRIIFIQHKGYCVIESHLAKEFLDNTNSKKLDSRISSINVRGQDER